MDTARTDIMKGLVESLNMLGDICKDYIREVDDLQSKNHCKCKNESSQSGNLCHKKTSYARIDDIREEGFRSPTVKPEKWVPSEGCWFVHSSGEVWEMSKEKYTLWWELDREEVCESGRLFKTKDEAETAAKLQREFMRFLKWSFENGIRFEPKEYNYGRLFGYCSDEYNLLKIKMESGEVEF